MGTEGTDCISNVFAAPGQFLLWMKMLCLPVGKVMMITVNPNEKPKRKKFERDYNDGKWLIFS
jgi:hypothetical protein